MLTTKEEEEARSLSFQIGGLRSVLASIPDGWVQERMELQCSIDEMSSKLEQLRLRATAGADAEEADSRAEEDRQLELFPDPRKT